MGLIERLDEMAFWESDKPDAMREAAILYAAADKLRKLSGIPTKNELIITEIRERFFNYFGYELEIEQ